MTNVALILRMLDFLQVTTHSHDRLVSDECRKCMDVLVSDRAADADTHSVCLGSVSEKVRLFHV